MSCSGDHSDGVPMWRRRFKKRNAIHHHGWCAGSPSKCFLTMYMENNAGFLWKLSPSDCAHHSAFYGKPRAADYAGPHTFVSSNLRITWRNGTRKKLRDFWGVCMVPPSVLPFSSFPLIRAYRSWSKRNTLKTCGCLSMAFQFFVYRNGTAIE